LKTAIVHDWLDTYGGAEQVLQQMLQCYPDADVFSLVDFLPESQRQFLSGRQITTSFIQKLPFAKTHFRYYLPLMPWALSRFNLSNYDLVLSSSWAFAKAVKAQPGQVHVSYIHTPIRYAWDLRDTYLKQAMNNPLLRWLARQCLACLKLWDKSTANRGGRLIANSSFVAERIDRCWNRESIVLNPPVALKSFCSADKKEDFFVIVSRLVHYKAVDQLVEAFNLMPDKRLVIIGDGPMYGRLKQLAGPNVELMGYQPRDVVVDHLNTARAFVFAALEDFGIALVEAQACGTPVIAFGAGGALDSVIPYGKPNATGLFFKEQNPQSIIAAIEDFGRVEADIQPGDCKINAQRFALEVFRQRFMNVIEQTLNDSRTRSKQSREHRLTVSQVDKEKDCL
jgi:glycosyltransferase involved in cell wall biosynthesis